MCQAQGPGSIPHQCYRVRQLYHFVPFPNSNQRPILCSGEASQPSILNNAASRAYTFLSTLFLRPSSAPSSAPPCLPACLPSPAFFSTLYLHAVFALKSLSTLSSSFDSSQFCSYISPSPCIVLFCKASDHRRSNPKKITTFLTLKEEYARENMSAESSRRPPRASVFRARDNHKTLKSRTRIATFGIYTAVCYMCERTGNAVPQSIKSEPDRWCHRSTTINQAPSKQ